MRAHCIHIILLILININLSNAQFYGYHIYDFNGKVKICDEKSYNLIPVADSFELGNFLSYISGLAKYDTDGRLTTVKNSSSMITDSERKDSTVFRYDSINRVQFEIKYVYGIAKSKTRFSYDISGTKMDKNYCICDTNEFIVQHQVYTLNKNDEVIPKNEKDRNVDTCLLWKLEERFLYDSSGFLIEQQPGSDQLDTFRFKYENGLLIESTIGDLFRSVYEYNNKRERIKRFDIEPNGNKELSIKYEYYDNGLIKVEQWYKDNAVSKSFRFEYDFDQNGNWIRTIEYDKIGDNAELPTIITLRKIEYFE
jgi:hypothetical protein